MPTRFTPRSWRSVPAVLITGVAALWLAGCSGFHPIYTPVGQIVTGYAERDATPYVLQMDDVGMACAMGEALDPLVFSFSRVTSEPNTTGTLLQVLAGICSEREAVEQELRYLRASYQDNNTEMRDARTQMQHKYAATASRRLKAFERGMKAYRFDPGAEDLMCPSYRNDQDELTFMMALLSGAQAVMDDAKSGGQAGVSRALASQVERAAVCLKNDKWAGIPGNLRAIIWVLLPDNRPASVDDPWKVMAMNRQTAINGGLRTAIALELVMAENVGNMEVAADALAYLAEAESRFEANPRYLMVDRGGMEVAMAVSDRIWTTRYGHRTPGNRFGRISKEREPREDIDTEGLL
ncbi:MAG: hypothetical protein EA349_07245 [Halomonadaceae bacterium]|nr:MAG: hypothetical protein EA349_07245 [Halomonadaceae bacterium]